MARIDVLPSVEIIRGFKGILDYYLWRGLPCVRAWPRYRPAKQSPASLAAALVFGAVVKSYPLLADTVLESYRQNALDQPRTARDIMVTGIYGNLHEASMSDFLGLLTDCRDFLSDLTALLDALHSIDTDELVVRTEHSVLPDGAATTAAQATQLTALLKIDDLQDALESKHLDRLLVRGMDQLFSFKDTLAVRKTGAVSGANGRFNSDSPTAGQIWAVHTICAMDTTTAVTRIQHGPFHAGSHVRCHEQTKAFAISERSCWSGLSFLTENDYMRSTFLGSLVGDSITQELCGYILTKET